MKLVALDLSSSAGWAVFEADRQLGVETVKLVDSGLIELGQNILSFGEYPWSYVYAAEAQAEKILAEVHAKHPDVNLYVIEETNLGKNRYSQKFLEFLHLKILQMLAGKRVTYLSSSTWRSALGLQMSAEDRRNNGKLYRAKKKAESQGQKLDKKSLGIKGKINKKHLAIRYANATYGLKLKVKDNDIADAICLGTAFFKSPEPCDGQ